MAHRGTIKHEGGELGQHGYSVSRSKSSSQGLHTLPYAVPWLNSRDRTGLASPGTCPALQESLTATGLLLSIASAMRGLVL